MILSRLDFLIGLLVVLVLVVSIATTVAILRNSRSVNGQAWPSGGLFVGLGLFVAVAAHVFDLFSRTPAAVESPGVDPAIGDPYWVLSSVAFLMIAGGLSIAAMQRRQLENRLRLGSEKITALVGSGHQVDQRFHYLFNNTTDSVYCYEFEPPMPIGLPLHEQVSASHDAILASCNSVFAQILGAENPEDVIGSRFGDLDSSKNTSLHTRYFTAFIRNGYSLSDYEVDFIDSNGQRCVLNINLVGVLQDGKLARIWAIEANVLALVETKEALRRRHLFQSLVGTISAALVKATDAEADSVVERCLEKVCDFIGGDRAVIFWLEDNEETYSVSHIWSRIGNPFDDEMNVSSLPKLFDELRAMRPVRVDDIDAMSAEFDKDKEFILRTNAKAFVVMPLIVEGKLIGGFGVGRVQKPVSWCDQEVFDLQVISEIFGNFIGQLFSRRALHDALNGLRQATDRLEAENVYLREEIELTQGFDEIVGRSDAILRSLKLVEQVADTRTPVLLLGETGTGKELVARAVHEHSDRRDRSLVKVNCAALPANLIESELFGHERGAFTGAERSKRGRFDLADGSTLFLDEIAEIPIELQAKLLRVLQEGEFERLGGTQTIRVDVRIVAATNRDINMAVRNGEFRSDLFYRINTFPIELPALRDRGGDVELLARHFVKVHAELLGRNVSEISSAMMRQLRAYRWPGNIRELEGIVQRALISSKGPVLELAEPLISSHPDDDIPRILSSTISDLKLVERDHIVAVLDDTRWKISGSNGAAAQLGIPPSTLRSKMKKLGIERPH